MNRREFTGLVVAGSLFPLDFVKSLGSSSKDYTERVLYPLYYFPVGGNDVFKLWVPEGKSDSGFVLNFPDPLTNQYLFTVMAIENHPWHPYRLFSTYTPRTLATAPAESFIQASYHRHDSNGAAFPTKLTGDTGVPYLGTRDFWCHEDGPIIFASPDICKTWESYGYLVRAKPYCTFTEFVTDGVR